MELKVEKNIQISQELNELLESMSKELNVPFNKLLEMLLRKAISNPDEENTYTMFLSETSLKDWLSPEEDDAWKDL